MLVQPHTPFGAKYGFSGLSRSFLSQFPGASAAYSLRQLAQSSTAVVRVRRSSDDAEQDFTASQVSGGALVNWVNEEMIATEAEEDLNWTSFTNNGDGFTGVSDGSSRVWMNPGTDSNNTTITVTFDVDRIDAGTLLLQLRNKEGSLDIKQASNPVGGTIVGTNFEATSTGSKSVDFVMSGATAGNYTPYFVYNSSGNTATVSNVRITGRAEQGAVSAWYDQNLPTSQDRMYFDTNKFVSFSELTNLKSTTTPFRFKFKTIIGVLSGVQRLIAQQDDGGSFNGFSVYTNNSNLRFDYIASGTSDRFVAGAGTLQPNTEYEIEIIYDGSKNINGFSLFVNGVERTISLELASAGGAISSNTLNSTTPFEVGRSGATSTFDLDNGSVWDVEYDDGDTGTNNNRWQGHGNLDEDWEDQVGSNNGTVNGNPARCLPDLSVISKDAIQETAADQPLIVKDGAAATNSNGNIAVYNNANTEVRLSVAEAQMVNATNGSWTAFAVCEYEAVTNPPNYIFGHDGDERVAQMIKGNTDDSEAVAFNTAGTPFIEKKLSALTAGQTIIQTGILDASQNLNTYVDGAPGTPTAVTGTPKTATDTSDIFSRGNSGTSSPEGRYISEILIFGSDQTASRADIEANINDHYGVY